jgi:hypothetical protein
MAEFFSPHTAHVTNQFRLLASISRLQSMLYNGRRKHRSIDAELLGLLDSRLVCLFSHELVEDNNDVRMLSLDSRDTSMVKDLVILGLPVLQLILTERSQ